MGRVTQRSNAIGTFNYTRYQGTSLIDHVVDLNPSSQPVLTSTFSYFTSGASDELLQSIVNTAATGGTISAFNYGYNSVGDITNRTQTTGTFTPVAYQYGYDGADQLDSAIETNEMTQALIGTDAYWYDGARNRLGQQINDSVSTASYNNLNQLIAVSGSGAGGQLLISGSLNEPGTIAAGSSVVSTDSNDHFSIIVPVITGTTNYIPMTATSSGTSAAQTAKTLQVNVASATSIPSLSYDGNGNLTYDGTRTYVWNVANQLVKIWYGTVGASASTSMSYDPLGRRSQIVETASNGTITSTKNLIWDDLEIREERDASNSITKLFFERGVQLSGSNYYYTQDNLASIRELVSGTSGSIQSEYDYDPYGQQTLLSGTLNADFGYTGQYYHMLSGMVLATYREYSPALGRWISRDPIGEAGGINLYGYVGNNPVNFTDPLGLTYASNAAFLSDFLTGGGATNRCYGPSDQETKEMENSPGANALRNAFNNGGQQNVNNFGYGSGQAAWDTLLNPSTADWGSTAAQVGGFAGASAVNNGNGTVTYTIPNVAGAHSFFYHAVPDRSGTTGPLRSINQTFQWTEPTGTNGSGKCGGH